VWIAGLVLCLAADPQIEKILAVLDARDGALRSFAASYYETVDGERIGPRFFAWSPERSLYRGPKFSRPFGVQSWFTGSRVKCESIYYKDTRQVLWLRRELEPVTMVWQGTRQKSSQPWIAEESGFFWDNKLLSEFLRERCVQLLGREPVDGHPCVKLMVTNKSGKFPDLLWLAEDCDYFPCRAVEHDLGSQGPAQGVRFSQQRGKGGPVVRLGEWIYSPTEETHWEELRNAGPIWYPLRVRITSVYDDDRVIEAVPGSVRFNGEVTEDDFDLPWLYFLDDSLDSGYAAVTPFLRITLEGASAVAVLVLCGGVIVWHRRRRAAAG
jgi:hypothetical protein